MGLKALVLGFFLAGLLASFALAGPPRGGGKGDGGKGKGAATTTGATTTTTSSSTVTLCHRTGSAAHPYVKIKVSTYTATKAHLKQGDVLADASGACPAYSAR